MYCNVFSVTFKFSRMCCRHMLDYKEAYLYIIKSKPFYVTRSDISLLDVKDILKSYVGLVSYNNKYIALDTFYQEISDLYPYIFDNNLYSIEDILTAIIFFIDNYRSGKYSISELENVW